jgi:hypothetical protein
MYAEGKPSEGEKALLKDIFGEARALYFDKMWRLAECIAHLDAIIQTRAAQPDGYSSSRIREILVFMKREYKEAVAVATIREDDEAASPIGGNGVLDRREGESVVAAVIRKLEELDARNVRATVEMNERQARYEAARAKADARKGRLP